MNIHSKLKHLIQPAGLLVLCFLAYGVFISKLGFYLDDWYIVWFYRMHGASGFVDFFRSDRPLLAYVYMVFVPIFGDSRVAWQIFAVITRWIAVTTFWYLLLKILPRKKTYALIAAILLAVYPGFQFHWFSVMYSQVYLLMAFYILSYVFMVEAITRENKKLPWILAAVICEFIGIAPMEYFYGLELVRPIVIWVMLVFKNQNPRKNIKAFAAYWIPYFIVFIGFTFFRILSTQSYSYKISLLDSIKQQPIVTIQSLISKIFWAAYDFSILAWVNLAQILRRNMLTSASMAMIALVVFGSIFIFFLLRHTFKNHPHDDHTETGMALILVGLYATIAGMLPYIMANFEIDLKFPSNRFSLSMAPGISLFVVGIIQVLIKTNKQRITIVALLAGFSIGSQFLTARSFMLYWDQQKDFLAQLTWRIPALKENTILISKDLPFSQYFSGTSLTAPLNLIYDSNNKSHNIRYLLLLSSGGQGPAITSYEPDRPLQYSFRSLDFSGNTSNMIAFYKSGDGCLRVLSKADTADQFIESNRYNIWNDILPLSNLDQIIIDPEGPASLPQKYFGEIDTNQWCYYYEKADLERQQMNWDAVIRYYDQANEKSFEPEMVIEWIPLIEAYANTDQIEKAIEMTRQFIPEDESSKAVFCNTWSNLRAVTNQKSNMEMIDHLMSNLNCKENK